MHIISTEELPDFVESLRRHLPKSLIVYCIGRNRLRKQCDWPGTEIVVDQYPNYSVCISRPIAGSESYVAYPFEQSDGIVIFATNAAAAEKFLQIPEVLSWNNRLTFLSVAADLVSVIHELSKKFGNLTGHTEDYRCNVVTASKEQLETQKPTDIPDGMHEKPLDATHVNQIAREWALAGRATEEKVDIADTHKFLRYLLENAFPSLGLFNDAEELIGYCMYDFMGCLGKAFTREDYRNRGILTYINYRIAKKVFDELGQEIAWGDIRSQNAPSMKVAKKVHAEVVPEWQTHSMYFTPRNGTG